MGGAGFNPFGQGGFSSSSGFGGFGDIFSDIFSAFSGGGSSSGGRAAANQPRQGDDIELETVLAFKEACFGCKKEVTYSRIEKCPTCGGTGAKGANGIKTCTKCGGRGRIVVQQRTMLGVMQTERVCDMCGGTGKIITDPCPDCKGKGQRRIQRRTKRELDLDIQGETASAVYQARKRFVVRFAHNDNPSGIRRYGRNTYFG